MTMPPTHPPRAPAAAYAYVDALMPDWYWTRQPPMAGVILHIRDRIDRNWTRWEMSEELAGWLVARLAGLPVDVRTEIYTTRRP